jgi:hypothetical protein
MLIGISSSEKKYIFNQNMMHHSYRSINLYEASTELVFVAMFSSRINVGIVAPSCGLFLICGERIRVKTHWNIYIRGYAQTIGLHHTS